MSESSRAAPLLELAAVTVVYPNGPTAPILEDFSLTVESGTFLAVVGKSGSGKSTLLHTIAQFLRPVSGSIRLKRAAITEPGIDIGFVGQRYALFPWLTVEDNVAFGLRSQRRPDAEIRRSVAHLLDVVGLSAYMRYYPEQLSGSMQQRAALARAMAPNPSLLLLDEPFSALDTETPRRMRELLLCLWRGRSTTIIFVNHDIEEALLLADKVLILTPGSGRAQTIEVPFPRPRSRESRIHRAFPRSQPRNSQRVRSVRTRRRMNEKVRREIPLSRQERFLDSLPPEAQNLIPSTDPGGVVRLLLRSIDMTVYPPTFEKVYVISDIHMGGQRNDEDNFQVFNQGTRLARFIRQIAQGSPNSDIALVINGDLFDFLAEDVGSYVALDAAIALRTMKRLYTDASFSPVWQALATFIKTPHRHLIIIVGNHDIELALPVVEHSIREALTGANAEASARMTFSTVGGGYTCRVGRSRIFCTHGNELDAWNWVDYSALGQLANAMNGGRRVDASRWKPNAGTRLVVDAMNVVKRKLPFVDLLKPESASVASVLMTVDLDLMKKIKFRERVAHASRQAKGPETDE